MAFRSLLAAVLLSMSAGVATQALAGPPPAEMTDREKVLYAIVRTEIEAMAGFVAAIKEAVEAHPSDTPEEVQSSWEAARAKYEECKALHAQDTYRPAYFTCRESFGTLTPAADWAIELPDVPESVPEAIQQHAQIAAKRIDKIAPHVESNPDGKAAYDEAKTKHAGAVETWKGGDKREGFRQLVDAVKRLDDAIRLTWPEAN